MTDPVADMLTRVRNAVAVSKRTVDVPFSKLKKAIAEALVREGYIGGFEVGGEGTGRVIEVKLKYGPDGEKVISGIRRESKPGRRVYRGSKDVPRVLDGLGVAILSTSKGVLSDRECRRARVGGEVLCSVW